jgi:hypothetical protein
MEGLGSQIAKLPDVNVLTYEWDDWGKAWQSIIDFDKSDKIALIGYSGGGSRATVIAGEPDPRTKTLPHIDLLVAYDPSPKWQMWPLHSNVTKAICYHNKLPLMFGLGGGQLTAAPVSPCTQIMTREIAEPHLLVQVNEELHDATIQAIKDM